MIETFLSHLSTIKGYSDNTVRAYELDLRSFAKYAKNVDSRMTWGKVTKGFIESWIYTMHDEDYNNATICRRISSLRSYYKWAISQGLTNENPARYISSPKIGDRLPNTIDTQAIKNALYKSGAELATKAIIGTAFETGLRLQEILDLRWEQVNTANNTIRVTGKGNKQRIVLMGIATAMLLDRLHMQNGSKLFGGLEQREARAKVYAALKPYSNDTQLSPHAIRHTFATEMLNNGASIKAISELLGHESVKTTEIYAHMGTPAIKNEYNQFAPRL